MLARPFESLVSRPSCFDLLKCCTASDQKLMVGRPATSINSQGCLCFSLCLTGYNFTDASFGSLSYHRTVEAFKFAYGQRLRLGDPSFNETVNEVRVGVVAMWLLGGVVTWQRHHISD